MPWCAADPVETIVEMTRGLGAPRVIDAVGVDANRPHSDPAATKADQMEQEFQKQMKMVAPRNKKEGDNWHQGDAYKAFDERQQGWLKVELVPGLQRG